MKTEILMIRTSSFHHHPAAIISPRSPSGDAGRCFLRRSRSIKLSPRSLQIDASERRENPQNPLRRARSDTDLLGSLLPQRTWSPPVKAVEEEEESEITVLGIGDLWRSVPAEEVEYTGGGIGKGRKTGGCGGQNENEKIGEYYEEMLRADPANPLLLRNYGRFLHEVEGDVRRAEECYGRAILASPGDGEVLSLYGKLVWEADGDGERAGGYFERAVQASPDDCYVLGSYAQFLWDAEEEEEEVGAAQPPMVVVF